MDIILEDKITTMDQTRKWCLQSFENMKTMQTDLYDLVNAINAKLMEQKISYDYAHDTTLSKEQRSKCCQDVEILRAQINELLDNWFNKYIELRF